MRLLLVEDDSTLGLLVRRRLSEEAMLVDWVRRIDDAASAAQAVAYDLVLLDRGLPDGDGLTLIPMLRRSSGSPRILVLTASGATRDRVEGLDAGADDYLPKPFDPDELAARCRALARRDRPGGEATLRVANLSLDLSTRGVTIDGAGLPLPRRELLVLECLMRSRSRVVPRERLFEQVYGIDDEIESNSLEAHVSRLRKTLRGAGARVELRVVRGVGYFIAPLPERGTP